MKTLNKKIWRDIWQNKSQFISIFIMTLLGILAFSGIHGYMDGMEYSAMNYYDQYNLQDLWLTGENFSEDDLKEIKKIDNVKDAERKLSINTTLDGYHDISLETNFIESNNISKFYVVEGEGFDINQKGVWLDSYLANYLKIKVGDEISFTYKTYTIKEKVLGLVDVPDHVYYIKDDTAIFPTHKDYGFVYLSINEFPIENYHVFPYVMVDVDDTSILDETKLKIENNIKAAKAVTTREDNFSYKGYNSEIEEGDTYSGVFTFMFLFIAILAVVTTMYRFVRKQRTQIGTMKALGIKKRKIIIHYVSFGFWISLIASCFGIVIGLFTIGNFFLNMEMTYFVVPEYHIYVVPDVYVLAGLTVAIITIITYLSCRTVLREKAADAIRVEIPKVKQSKFDLTNKGIFKNASLSTKWNLRDIARNKGRTIMGAVGIIGCTMMLVCAFGMLDTMNSYIDWQFDTLYHFEYKLDLDDNLSKVQLEKLEEKYGDATSKTYGIEFMDGNTKKANTLTVNDSKDKLRYTGHDKNVMELKEGGIYITEKLSVTLNKNVGDEIKWHIFGEDTWYTSKIVGLNRDPQSQAFNTTRSYIESLNIEYEPDTIYTNNNLEGVKEVENISKIAGIESIKTGILNMINTVRMMVVLLIAISAVLGFVIIYNLGILSFAEKQYQFATLKVLGYKNKQIKKIFIKQNTWITIVSVIVGLPLGYLMVDYIFKSALGENYDFPAVVSLMTYVYATIGTFIVSFFVNRALARKVKNIDMVTSLKGNE
ncbi:MAG: FtsX-like permease family protein [Clostridia bacterium]|nr:FtsX-like permease family protein [Clostridia bacterium]